MKIPGLQAARRFLEQGDDFVLTTHVNSDGDGIGGCLALRAMLCTLGKKTEIILNDPPDEHYDFLEEWSVLRQMSPGPQPKSDYAVVLDCPSLERIGDVQQHIGGQTRILNIDHHHDNRRYGEVNLVSPGVSSSCEMVYHLAGEMNIALDASSAAQLYAGILFDTGGFRYSLTTPLTHEVAAALMRCGIHHDRIADRLFGNRSLEEVKQLGRAIDALELHCEGQVASLELDHEAMKAGDSEDVVNYGLVVKGVEVAVLFKELEPGKYRISLRSRDKVDVSQIAARFGGGGHHRASGCRLEGTREQVRRELLDAIKKHLNCQE